MGSKSRSIRSGGGGGGKMHGTRTYDELNRAFGEWYDDPDRDRGSPSIRSKTKSRATLSQVQLKGETKGWRKKEAVTIQLPSISSRKLAIWLAGSDEDLDFIESTFIPLLNDAASKALKTENDRFQRYLERLLDMCVRLASADMFNQIEFDSPEERKVFRYNLWLLGSACLQLLDHLGVNHDRAYGSSSALKTVYPVYFAKPPMTKDLPEHKKQAKKKWWK